MLVHRPRRSYAPFALALSGGLFGLLAALFGLLAAVDKVFGVVQRPLHLATLAYVLSLFALLFWLCLAGIRFRPFRPGRLSLYTGFLVLNVLTAAYAFAVRACADPTPVLLESALTH